MSHPCQVSPSRLPSVAEQSVVQYAYICYWDARKGWDNRFRNSLTPEAHSAGFTEDDIWFEAYSLSGHIENYFAYICGVCGRVWLGYDAALSCCSHNVDGVPDCSDSESTFGE
jgi:hypothetical protein